MTEPEVDPDLLFESFVRDYRTFGLGRNSNWTRYTTEYMRWFAHEGMSRGFHVEQEVVYPEPSQLAAQKERKADMVWVTDPDRPLDKDVFFLHLESETEEQYVELTLDLLAYSPFKPLPLAVAILHRVTTKSKPEFVGKTLAYAMKRFKSSTRTLLVMLDLVWNEGDGFLGLIVRGDGSWKQRTARGLLYRWRGAEYFDLKLEE